MTPKEKAKEIVDRFWNLNRKDNWSTRLEYELNIQQAEIAVNLRLEGDFSFTSIEYGEDSLEYWKYVKQEIESFKIKR